MTQILSASFTRWDHMCTRHKPLSALHAGITCVRDTDCQRYTAGTTYMKHRLSALHAGTTCVRDTNWLSALHDGITCMNTMNTSVCTSLAVLILRCFFLDIVGLTASKSCFNLTLQPGRYDPHPTPVPLSPPQSSKHRQPKRLVKDRFLRLARLFGTVCLRHSATLIPFFATGSQKSRPQALQFNNAF